MATFLDDILSSILFLTRLPVARFAAKVGGTPDFRDAARVFPIVGAVIGAVGGLVLVTAHWLTLPPTVAAILTIAVTFGLTGGLHEDGLADTADGFGGGKTAAQKRLIMRDSRIGTYGAAALVLALLLRTMTLATLAAVSPAMAALALIAAESVSRAALVYAWHRLPATSNGLAEDTGPPDSSAAITAAAVAAAVSAGAALLGLAIAAVVAGILLSALATYIFTRIVGQQIGGHSGDTLGACQQLAAIGFLVGTVSGA